jgi:hypothetical protein
VSVAASNKNGKNKNFVGTTKYIIELFEENLEGLRPSSPYGPVATGFHMKIFNCVVLILI